jgi:hypothetical protein
VNVSGAAMSLLQSIFALWGEGSQATHCDSDNVTIAQSRRSGEFGRAASVLLYSYTLVFLMQDTALRYLRTFAQSCTD